MRSKLRQIRNVVRAASRTILLGPQALAFVPALTLAGFWLGGEGLLVLLALILPVSFALVRQSRLSVMPVTAAQWALICQLGETQA